MLVPKIRELFLIAVVALVAVSSVPRAAAQAQISLRDLDQILESSGSLENFLKSPEQIEKYYQTSAAYYGGEKFFPRVSFEAVLNDFRRLIEMHPEFAQEAWNVRPTKPPFSIKSALKTFGVKSRAENLKASWLAFLGINETDLGGRVSASSIQSDLERLWAELNGVLSTANETRRAQAERAKRIGDLKRTDVFVRLRKNILVAALQSARTATLLNERNADIFLNTYSEFRIQPMDFLIGWSSFSNFEREIKFVVQSLPTAEALAQNPLLFEKTNPSSNIDISTYTFIEVDRPFHAIFRGIKHRECVGGSCNRLEWIYSGRYGIPLLHGNREIHVYRDGKFTGYISTLESTYKGQVYNSLEVMTPFMDHHVWVTSDTGENRRFEKASLLDLWIGHETSRSQSLRFVIGQSGAINNAGGLASLKTSGAWLEANAVGSANEFVPTDVRFKKLLRLADGSALPAKYRNGLLVSDLGMSSARTAFLLKPSKFDWSEAQTPVWFQARFKHSVSAEARLWAALRYLPVLNDPDTRTTVAKEAVLILEAFGIPQRPQHRIAKQFIEQCEAECARALFKYAFLKMRTPEEFINALKWKEIFPQHLRHEIEREIFENHVSSVVEFFKEGKVSTNWLDEVKPIVSGVDAMTTLMKALIPHVRSFSEYIAVTDIGLIAATDALKIAVAKVHMESLPMIIKVKPTPSQWWQVRYRLGTVEEQLVFLRAATHQALSAAEFLDIVTTPKGVKASDAMVTKTDAFILESSIRFESLQPTSQQRESLLRVVNDESTRRVLKEKMMSPILSCRDLWVRSH